MLCFNYNFFWTDGKGFIFQLADLVMTTALMIRAEIDLNRSSLNSNEQQGCD